MRIIAVALLLTVSWAPFGAAQSKGGQSKSAFDKATLEAYLRHVELYRSAVTFKIDDPKPSKNLPGFSEVAVHVSFEGGSKDELYYVSKDGQTIINGDVYNVGQNPFQSNLDRLTSAGAPSFGTPNAPITIFEFGDLQCPDCKMEAPVLRTNLMQSFPGKVRVYFKDFPLESLHPWARAAAIAGRCVYRQGEPAFWNFYDWIYENQEQIDPGNLQAKILAWAGQKGLDSIQLGRCIDTKSTESEVNSSIAEGRALGIRGTPTLFIDGRKIGGLQWPDLQLVINNELQYQSQK
jgi:protein-disulfide isomerase